MEVKRSERKSSQTDGSSSSSSSTTTTTTTTTTITATSSSSSSSFSSSRTTLESWDFVARCWDPHLRRADACLLGDRGRLRSRQCDITRPMSAQASCDHRHAHGPGEPGPGPGPVGGRDHRHANEPGEPVGGGPERVVVRRRPKLVTQATRLATQLLQTSCSRPRRAPVSSSSHMFSRRLAVGGRAF